MTDINQWKVILVDDEADSRALVHDLLAFHGAEIYEAGDSGQCLAFLEDVMPTLFIVDLAMPQPNGWDLLAQIRANPGIAAVPVVAVTAYCTETVIQCARQVGFAAVLPKPIKCEPFLNALKALVG